jgi:hypothetical protein
MDMTHGVEMREAVEIKWGPHQHEQKQYTSRNQSNTLNEEERMKWRKKEYEKERRKERKKKRQNALLNRV